MSDSPLSSRQDRPECPDFGCGWNGGPGHDNHRSGCPYCAAVKAAWREGAKHAHTRAEFPRICRECRLPILNDAVPHRCEQLVCPTCLGLLSRKGFCPSCIVRYGMPAVDPLERLAELEAYFAVISDEELQD